MRVTMNHARISGETFQRWSSKPPTAPLNLAKPDVDSPLVWWRTRMAEDFSRSDLAPLRGALKGTQINFEPRWSAAVRGDAAAAIGIAVRQLKIHPTGAREVDLALSATVACAIERDAASPILISWALILRSRNDPRYRAQSDSWLVVDF
ncbi:hypothetical protein [Tardiphaga sp. 803_E3_N1_3]|uniref:hypothetical protein n=1 Tax=Tardiphaga sp. 803_E3_N1_3 TaxID=3240785 RepID=UPI003F237089